MRRRGFTLIEMMIATLIAMVGVMAAFAFARAQVRSYEAQGENGRAQASARMVLEVLARDLRNAGYGTSFYAGMQAGGFGGNAAVIDGLGQSRGFPALRIADNVATAGVMPGSDAVLLLRVTSAEGTLLEALPCSPGPGPYSLDPTTSGNLAPCIAAGGLVLISDATRPTSEPESMLLALNPASPADTLLFANAYGIDPAAASRCTDNSVPPDGAGVGATAVCVQPVSYWVDDRAQLRAWMPTPATAVAPVVAGARVPIDPAADAVLAQGVEDLQLAVFMSAEAPAAVRNNWAFAAPPPAGAIPTYTPADEGELAEARVVRISALVRSARAPEGRQESRAGLLANGTHLEDHLMPAAATLGCSTYGVCYDPGYARKLLSFQAELRNMRLFDLLSDPSRTWALMRSFRP